MQSWWRGGGIYGDEVNNTCHTLTTKPSLPSGEVLGERYNIPFPPRTRTAPKLFQLAKLWVIKWTWWLDKGFLGRGKSRRKQDFSPLYRYAAFFSMRGNLKTRLPCITTFHLLLCSQLEAMVREFTGDKVHNVRVTIFLGVFFYYSRQSKHVFSSWITTNLYQQLMQMNELCAVWVMTEESLKRYPVCVLVPFLADRKDGIFDFILN